MPEKCQECGAPEARPIYWPSGGSPIGTEYTCGSIIYDPHVHKPPVIGYACLERQLAAARAKNERLRRLLDSACRWVADYCETLIREGHATACAESIKLMRAICAAAALKESAP